MMIYLTGASSSRTQGEATQTDPLKSLGGYISTSQAPNGSLNTLFDLLSAKTLREKPQETIALGLVNTLDHAVTNVRSWILSGGSNVCSFRLAAVGVDENLCMENIENRYATPLAAEFYDVTLTRASVDVCIMKAAVKGEEIYLEPFDVTAIVTKGGFEGTFSAIARALSSTSQYTATRLSERRFRIESNGDEPLDEPLPCSYLATEGAELEFGGDFCNETNNSAVVCERLESGEAIGLWLQRQVGDNVELSDKAMIWNYNHHITQETEESVRLVIAYDEEEGTGTGDGSGSGDGSGDGGHEGTGDPDDGGGSGDGDGDTPDSETKGLLCYGFSSAETADDLDIGSLELQWEATSPRASVALVAEENGYPWFCIPEDMEIRRVTLNSIEVPLEDAEEVDTLMGRYKCYRGSNMLVPDTYEFVVL